MYWSLTWVRCGATGRASPDGRDVRACVRGMHVRLELVRGPIASFMVRRNIFLLGKLHYHFLGIVSFGLWCSSNNHDQDLYWRRIIKYSGVNWREVLNENSFSFCLLTAAGTIIESKNLPYWTNLVVITNLELNGGRELVNCFNIEVRDGQNKNQITKQKPKNKNKQTNKRRKKMVLF